MAGPAPKHPSARARRNNPTAGFRSLPKDGREGPVPEWPLLPDVVMTVELSLARSRVEALSALLADEEDGRTKGRLRKDIAKNESDAAKLALALEQSEGSELSLWADLWGTPQAVIWEESHAVREVAQYVRWKIRAEQGDIKAATEARMLSDRLGLNPLALMRLRAEVENAEASEDRGRRRRSEPTPPVVVKADGDDPRRGLHAV